MKKYASYMPYTSEEQIRQQELYKKHIFPHEGELYWFLTYIRHLIDEQWKPNILRAIWDKRGAPASPFSHRDVREYPRGFCTEICRNVEKILETHKLIKDFVAQGGVFGHDYRVANVDGMAKGFANVIRIGDRIIDPSASEFSKDDQPRDVDIVRDNGVAYAPINYHNFIETAKIYWGDQIYPSNLFIGDALAAYLPFVQVSSDGSILDFPITHPQMIHSMMETAGESLRMFLRDPGCRLTDPPQEIVSQFRRNLESYLESYKNNGETSTIGIDIEFGNRIKASKTSNLSQIIAKTWQYPSGMDGISAAHQLHDQHLMPLVHTLKEYAQAIPDTSATTSQPVPSTIDQES